MVGAGRPLLLKEHERILRSSWFGDIFDLMLEGDSWLVGGNRREVGSQDIEDMGPRDERGVGTALSQSLWEQRRNVRAHLWTTVEFLFWHHNSFAVLCVSIRVSAMIGFHSCPLYLLLAHPYCWLVSGLMESNKDHKITGCLMPCSYHFLLQVVGAPRVVLTIPISYLIEPTLHRQTRRLAG